MLLQRACTSIRPHSLNCRKNGHVVWMRTAVVHSNTADKLYSAWAFLIRHDRRPRQPMLCATKQACFVAKVAAGHTMQHAASQVRHLRANCLQQSQSSLWHKLRLFVVCGLQLMLHVLTMHCVIMHFLTIPRTKQQQLLVWRECVDHCLTCRQNGTDLMTHRLHAAAPAASATHRASS